MTAIEWTQIPGFKGETWNPIVGCSVVSPGCTNCYAMKMAARIERMDPSLEHYRGLTQASRSGAVWTGKVSLAPDSIRAKPLRAKQPRAYFVNSMGDLFHEDAPDDWIDRVFAVMALCPQHIFMVLTKRAARMRRYAAFGLRHQHVCAEMERITLKEESCPVWPLPNVWLGVTAEDQPRAEERIPALLATPAAKRFVSYEPALGPVDFTAVDFGARFFANTLLTNASEPCDAGIPNWRALDWVIAGGESGRDARPPHPDWFYRVQGQCAAARVPFFFKQWGEYAPRDRLGEMAEGDVFKWVTPAGLHNKRKGVDVKTDAIMQLVGKKAAGALLDGREHREWPIA